MKYVIHKNGKTFAFNSGKYRPLKQFSTEKGYLTVTTYSLNGPRLTRTVHRLVADGYISNPEEKPQLNHKNGVKTDNRVENLEWCTAQENISHAFATGLRKPGHQGGSIHWMKNTGQWIGQLRNCGKKYRKASVDKAKVEAWLKSKLKELGE